MNTTKPHDPAHAQYVDPEGRCLWCARLYLEPENAKLRTQLEDYVGRYSAMVNHEIDLNNKIEELVRALDRAHSVERCPYGRHGLCDPCNALEKFKGEIPDQHLVGCAVCKTIIKDTFQARKDAWCEECGLHVCPLCWTAHNMNQCRTEKQEGN